jgi:hypothetical protein
MGVFYMVLIYLLSLVLERNKAYVKKHIKPYEWEYEEWQEAETTYKAKDESLFRVKLPQKAD